MRIMGIYKIQSLVKPERCYVGSAADMNKRWRQHLYSLRKNKHHSPKLQRHYNKYGEFDLVFIIIEPCLPQFLTIREDSYLKPLPYFNTCLKAGSKLGTKQSSSERKKRSIIVKRLWENPEYRNQMSNSHIGLQAGEKHGMFGKHHSDESNLQNSKAHKGKSAWNKGKSLSDEHCKNLSISHMGKPSPKKGKKYKKSAS